MSKQFDVKRAVLKVLGDEGPLSGTRLQVEVVKLFALHTVAERGEKGMKQEELNEMIDANDELQGLGLSTILSDLAEDGKITSNMPQEIIFQLTTD